MRRLNSSMRRVEGMILAGALCVSICHVSVEPAYAASKIKLSKTTLKLTVGKTATLKLKKLSKKKAKKLKWKSTKKSVVTVSYNKKKAIATVKAKKKGTAKIKVTYNKKTYVCKVKVKNQTPTITPADIDLEKQKLPVTDIVNARQLGGYETTDGKKVKANLLLRTAKLSTATDEDLAVLKNDFNLGYIVDLRKGCEDLLTIAGGKDPEIEGVKEVFAGFAGPSQTEPDAYAKSLKKKETIQSMKLFLQTLLDNKGEKAVIFHCSLGKDRTGIMAAVILSIFRVSDEIILGDYMLSSHCYSKINQLGMENALLYMREESGSVENFVIEKTGLTSADMELLRQYYLE